MCCTATAAAAAAAKKPNAPQADGWGGGGGRGAYNQSLCVCECVGEVYCVDVFVCVCDEALKTGAPQHLCARSSSAEGPAHIDGMYGSGVCSCLRVGGVPVQRGARLAERSKCNSVALLTSPPPPPPLERANRRRRVPAFFPFSFFLR